MDKEKIKEALSIINAFQQQVWKMSHKVKEMDYKIGESMWFGSIQAEHSLLVLNEEVLGGEGYFENES